MQAVASRLVMPCAPSHIVSGQCGAKLFLLGGYFSHSDMPSILAQALKETLGQERSLGDAYDKDYQNEKALQWIHRHHILGICKEE